MSQEGAKVHPLPRGGTRQPDRNIAALDPSSVQIEDRNEQDWLRFGQELASTVRYRRTVDELETDVEHNWQPFFDDFDFNRYFDEPEAFADDLEKFSESPHGGLYTIYLRWLSRVRDELNGLSDKHLDFYYQDVLRLAPRDAKGDQVHVIFEPAKNKDQIRVPAGTTLKAGETLTYATDSEMFVGQSKIEALHSIYADHSPAARPRFALEAKSLDGYGEPLTEEAPNWKPFGRPEHEPIEAGFALASPILALKEGERTITVTVTLRGANALNRVPNDDELKTSLSIELSGTEEWLGPFAPTTASFNKATADELTMVLSVAIGADEDPIDFYNVSLLEGGFDTVSPVLKVMLAEDVDMDVYRLLSLTHVHAVDIDVDVVGAKELDIENDLGRLNADKPFYPFGPQPVRGGSFYVSSEEMLSKQVTDFKLRVKWLDVPSSLATRYAAYIKNKIYSRYPKLTEANLTSTYNRYVANNSHFQAEMSLAKRGRDESPVTVNLFDKDDATLEVELDSTPAIRPLQILPYFFVAKYFSKAATVVQAKFPRTKRVLRRSTSPIARRRRRRAKNLDRRIRIPVKAKRQFRVQKRKFGVIRLTLKQGFFHRVYPHYLSATIADEDSTVSPEEPYTPVIESLELDYSASIRDDGFNDDDFDTYNKKTVQIFQLSEMGHAEQHAYLKGELSFATDKATRLLPNDPITGALLMGISGLEERESISFLVQVAPGTANPLRTRQPVEWSVLVRNHWRPLAASEILIDETNELLASGIVRLQMPGEPLHDNTLFSSDLTWIRASFSSPTDSVCDLKDIHLHAVCASVHQMDDAPPIQGAIPAESIAKLRAPIAAIKSVAQPYDSFGGVAAEVPAHFRRRVSERLRHKQRAITAGDYERLVLQQFPELHMVRCLTHTDENTCSAPGEVQLVIVPQKPPEARFDRLRPRADLDTVSRVEDFVNGLNTHHVTARVTNPAYEEVLLDFAVRFKSGFPFPPYREILNEALVQFLSPWVTDQNVMPAFGGSLHKSQIVSFIECLEYVDFVTDLNLYHGLDTSADRMRIEPSAADSILVSAAQHEIIEAELRI